MTDPTPDAELGPEAQLTTTLTVMLSFQQTIEHADSKANMMIAIQAGLLTVLVTGYGQVDPVVTGWRLGAFAVATTVASVTFASSVFCVVQVVRPRFSPPPGLNRFAFPWVARQGPPTGPVMTSSVIAEAWGLSERLAMIAMTKYLWLHRAVGLLSLAVLAAVVAGGFALLG